MKRIVPLLLCAVLLAAGTASEAQSGEHVDTPETCRKSAGNKDCNAGPAWCNSNSATCSPEMRGRCGKRRGDWYGARQPVATAAEARGLLQNYFSGHEYTVSDVTEKKWGFRAQIFDKTGALVDRVMIDKRSGRIRSLD